MKNKHRIKQCLSLLLAGGIALTNLGAALPAFAEAPPATPETAEAATPESAARRTACGIGRRAVRGRNPISDVSQLAADGYRVLPRLHRFAGADR